MTLSETRRQRLGQRTTKPLIPSQCTILFLPSPLRRFHFHLLRHSPKTRRSPRRSLLLLLLPPQPSPSPPPHQRISIRTPNPPPTTSSRIPQSQRGQGSRDQYHTAATSNTDASKTPVAIPRISRDSENLLLHCIRSPQPSQPTADYSSTIQALRTNAFRLLRRYLR